MIRKLVAAFVMILFAASLHSMAFAAATGYFPVDGDGSTTYTDGNFKAGDILRVEGCGFGLENWDKNDSFYKTFARQAARMEALHQLVEMIDGLKFEYDESGYISTTRISQDSKTFKLLEKNARVIDVKFLDGGGCAVTMEVVFPTDWHK